MAGKAAPIRLWFQKETDTKNKIRFEEVEEGTNKPVLKDKAAVEKLYISKKELKKRGFPETAIVTIEFP